MDYWQTSFRPTVFTAVVVAGNYVVISFSSVAFAAPAEAASGGSNNSYSKKNKTGGGCGSHPREETHIDRMDMAKINRLVGTRQCDKQVTQPQGPAHRRRITWFFEYRWIRPAENQRSFKIHARQVNRRVPASRRPVTAATEIQKRSTDRVTFVCFQS